ncbi:His/Gly/Thr/Pro-type tRNA ligase C-terminal domain-containing protein [bacterium]|nr:His/Gly/Thr/Pro-type tRNA ligase C-terminal domain-containing protein [bacterium]
MQIRNVFGKEDTIATVQIDFYSAKRFDLAFTNEKGEKEEPVIIHHAIMGSFDRFFAFLVEHYGGAFPFWLAPVQAAVLPVSEKHHGYAKEVFEELKTSGIRVELWDQSESLGKKIRNAKMQKIPYFLVVGDKEVESNTVTVESRDKGSLGAMELHKFSTLDK